EPELWSVATEAARLTEVHQRLDAEWTERLRIEGLRTGIVAHGERDVIDDRHVCPCRSRKKARVSLRYDDGPSTSSATSLGPMAETTIALASVLTAPRSQGAATT